MEPVVLSRIGGKFFAFVLPRIKNRKVYRDLQAKWSKDNYSTQVKNMFKAAIADSKAVFDISDELINDLLEDKINRDEIFRWIIEGITMEDFESSKLNLLPYIERYPQYQDYLEAFFITILAKIHDFQEIHWNPEFLQILSQVRSLNLELKEDLKQGFDKMEAAQGQFNQTLNEQSVLLNKLFEPVSFTDLNELIIAGDVLIARERAFERLHSKKVHTDEEIMELNAVIASCFIMNGQEKESIFYLRTAVNHCKNEPRKCRMLSLIYLFQECFEDALTYTNHAIEKEGYTPNNIEKLVDIYRRQGQHQLAIELLDKYDAIELKELRAYTLLGNHQFDATLTLAQKMLETEPENFAWQLIKLEAMVLDLQDQGSTGMIIDVEEKYQLIMPIIKKLESQKKQSERINKRLQELKAPILLWSNRYSEAKMTFEWLYNREYENKDFYFKGYLYCCLCDEDWNTSIQLLQERIIVGKVDIKDIVVLATAYTNSGDPQRAKELLEEHFVLVNMDDQFSIKFYFVYFESLASALNHSQIQTTIDTLEAKQYTQVGINALKAYRATILHDWDDAISQWESCIDSLSEELFVEAAMSLSQAYMNRSTPNDYKQLLKLIEKVPLWRQHESLVNRYARGLYELREYNNVIELVEQFPIPSIVLREIVSAIYFNFEWYEAAKEHYKALFQKTNDITFLSRYASCLLRLGSITECFNVLRSMEQRINEEPTAERFHLLSMSYLEAEAYHQSLEYAYKMFEIGKQDPQVWRSYFSLFLSVTQKSSNPLPEWINTYHFIFEHFSATFPTETPLYQAIKALNDDKTLSEQIIEMLKSHSESYNHKLNVVKENQFPPSFLAAFLDKGPYETWIYYFSSDMEFGVYQGPDLQDIDHRVAISKNSRKVFCDSYTLLTISELGHLDELSEMYDLYIHQSDYNELSNEYSHKKTIGERGLATLSYNNGQVIHHKNSAEEMQEYLKKHEEFILWINTHCTKIGNPITNNELDDQIGFLLQPLEACNDEHLNLLSDSYHIRGAAKELFNIQSFNTVEWIINLVLSRRIGVGRYFEDLGNLLSMGYTLLPINEFTILHHLQKNEYVLDDKIHLLLNYLKKDQIDHEYALGVSGVILQWIWLDDVPSSQQQSITEALCTVVTHNKNTNKVIQELLDITEPLFSSSNQDRFREMKMEIHAWLEQQNI
ncbi:hypothetical protein HGO21_08460 [Acinetobacter sp. CUI P1]|nr:hypothetical protein [Acinetobacter sp. CUI P1]